MFAFQQFSPRLLKSGGMFASVEYEPFTEVVARANEWVLVNEKQVINVETLLMPLNTMESSEPWTQSIVTPYHPGERQALQMIRVWYRT